MEHQALEHLYALICAEEERIGLQPLQDDDLERRVWRIMRSGLSEMFTLGNLLSSYQQQQQQNSNN